MAERTSFEALLSSHRALLCVGTGGVGKTTMAAALGLAVALRGRRVMVLTIDPARALARALGVARLDRDAHFVDLSPLGVHVPPGGALHAAMLDQKAAWDAFMSRHAPNAQVRDALLGNAFYQHLSTSLAGSTEYMAIEELCQLHDSGDYDLIVIDTPPAGHAVDFLSAPQRIDHLFDPEVAGWLAEPRQLMGRGLRAMSSGVRFVVRQAQRAAGLRTLRDITAFFVALDALFGDMQQRSRRAQALLRSEQTAFVLVAGPSERVLAEGDRLLGVLTELGVRLRGVVINRIHPLPPGSIGLNGGSLLDALSRLAERGVSAENRDWLQTTWERACATDASERRRLARFADNMPSDVAWVEVPELARDTHSLADLLQIAIEMGIAPATNAADARASTEEGATS